MKNALSAIITTLPSQLRQSITWNRGKELSHKHATMKQWLEKHPRLHLHFAQTSRSWLNLERWFRNAVIFAANRLR